MSAVPQILKKKSRSIVIVGAVQSMTAPRTSMAYVVSKHGLRRLTRSMALEVAADNIRVNCFFFFSSRRRHTRLQGDWSSDVCSSDLVNLGLRQYVLTGGGRLGYQ